MLNGLGEEMDKATVLSALKDCGCFSSKVVASNRRGYVIASSLAYLTATLSVEPDNLSRATLQINSSKHALEYQCKLTLSYEPGERNGFFEWLHDAMSEAIAMDKKLESLTFKNKCQSQRKDAIGAGQLFNAGKIMGIFPTSWFKYSSHQ